MYSNGKHIFCSYFVAVYDYKFYNHLVIVTYFAGSFTSLKEASKHKQGSLEQHVKFLPWKYPLLFTPARHNWKLWCIKKRPPRVDGGSFNLLFAVVWI